MFLNFFFPQVTPVYGQTADKIKLEITFKISIHTLYRRPFFPPHFQEFVIVVNHYTLFVLNLSSSKLSDFIFKNLKD